jgi:hypothetical protein
VARLWLATVPVPLAPESFALAQAQPRSHGACIDAPGHAAHAAILLTSCILRYSPTLGCCAKQLDCCGKLHDDSARCAGDPHAHALCLLCLSTGATFCKCALTTFHLCSVASSGGLRSTGRRAITAAADCIWHHHTQTQHPDAPPGRPLPKVCCMPRASGIICCHSHHVLSCPGSPADLTWGCRGGKSP